MNTKEEPCTTCKVISKRTPLVNNSALCVQFILVCVKCKKRSKKCSATFSLQKDSNKYLKALPHSCITYPLTTKHADVRQGQYVPVIYVLAPGASMSCLVLTHNALEPLRLQFSQRSLCLQDLFSPSILFFCLFLSLSFELFLSLPLFPTAILKLSSSSSL